MSKGVEQKFLHKRHKNGQKEYEKAFNITNQGNANQEHKEKSTPVRMVIKKKKRQAWVRMQRNQNPGALLVGM